MKRLSWGFSDRGRHTALAMRKEGFDPLNLHHLCSSEGKWDTFLTQNEEFVGSSPTLSTTVQFSYAKIVIAFFGRLDILISRSKERKFIALVVNRITHRSVEPT